MTCPSDATGKGLIRFTPASDVTTGQYDDVIQQLQDAGDFPPEGLEYHVAFVGDDGRVRVSEIWDSPEQAQGFGERLMPLLDQAGIQINEPEILQVHNIVKR